MSAIAGCLPLRRRGAKTVRLRLVEARETNAPDGVEPLHWRLLTTHEVTDAAMAWQSVAWYQARWTIEQLFRVMKSHGLQVEDSQLASADRLVKLAAVATKAACVDIQFVQEREGKQGCPRQPCSMSRRSKPSTHSARRLKAARNGRRIRTRLAVWPTPVG
jgi:hypothetical protein